jgi:endonuclease YncB( thermonuclease family)
MAGVVVGGAARALVIVACAAILSAAAGERLSGRVVAVADGDSLTVLTPEHRQVQVRLAQIDAPEIGQPSGRASRRSLADVCYGKQAVLQVQATDRYGRTVATVMCAGVDASAEQLRRGMAWAYRRYLADRTLLELEREAREAGVGLWQHPDPTPPWIWRRSR